MNNEITVSGVISADKKSIECRRCSGVVDVLPIDSTDGRNAGDKVTVVGKLRNANGKMYIGVNCSHTDDSNSNVNDVLLSGYLSSTPTLRETPAGKIISDFTLAVKRSSGIADYIRCIAWGGNAVTMSNTVIGARMSVTGRFQSREYEKNGETKTTYEVSVNRLYK